jgi:hypothetical protein
MSDDANENRRYVDYRLDDLKEGQEHQGRVLETVMRKLSDIEVELRAYKRAVQILVAIGSIFGACLGWFAKALGKA